MLIMLVVTQVGMGLKTSALFAGPVLLGSHRTESYARNGHKWQPRQHGLKLAERAQN